MINLTSRCLETNHLNPRLVGGVLAAISLVAFGVLMGLTLSNNLGISRLYNAIPGGLALLFALDLISCKQAAPERIKKMNDAKMRKQVAAPIPPPLEDNDNSRLKVIEGPGYPSAQDQNIVFARATATKATCESMKGIDLKPYADHLNSMPIQGLPPSRNFLPEGDVVQTVGQMDYDVEFKPVVGDKPVFFVHHACAYNMAGKKDFNAVYYDKMEAVFRNVLTAQAESGAEHFVWGYFGMGIFLHGAPLSVRIELAKRFHNALSTVMAKHPNVQLHMVGPKDLLNYPAFCKAFRGSPYLDRITMHPNSDILQVAHNWSLGYQGTQVAPVSLVNAANQHRLGNNWNQSDASPYGLDQNLHRRSVLTAALSEMINGQRETVQFNTPAPNPDGESKAIERVKKIADELKTAG